jgi:hypothetical protein
MVGELQGEGPGEVLDRADLVEDLAKALIEEPLERLVLYGEKVG